MTWNVESINYMYVVGSNEPIIVIEMQESNDLRSAESSTLSTALEVFSNVGRLSTHQQLKSSQKKVKKLVSEGSKVPTPYEKPNTSPVSQLEDDSSFKLVDGQIFSWKSYTAVLPEEMDRRVVQLSQNPPQMISHYQSIDEMINEMCLISPLWSGTEISDQRDMENRATIFFFEVVAKQFKPMRMFLDRQGEFNRYALEREKAELLARKMKFFIRRLASQSDKFNKPPFDEHIGWVSRLNFSGYHLGFLPDEVTLFEDLVKLELANCDLTKLPDSMGNLKKLHTLDLRGNKLEELPKTIANCPKLHFIHLDGNTFSYSSLIELTKDFLLKDNAWGAVHLASKANQIGNPESWFHSPFAEVVELLKTIPEKLFFKDKDDDDYLSYLIMTALDKISSKYDKIESFLEILVVTGKLLENCCFEDPQYGGLIKFRNKLADKCLEIAYSFPQSGRNNALCDISEALFSINDIPKAIEVAEQAIELTTSGPNYNFLTMINDIKSCALERISNMLERASEKIAREKRFELATQVVKIIPRFNKNNLQLS